MFKLYAIAAWGVMLLTFTGVLHHLCITQSTVGAMAYGLLTLASGAVGVALWNKESK